MSAPPKMENTASATTETSLRERLLAWLTHLEHVLPAQAPLRNFVHHNTLHGLQHMPFEDALAEANRVSGAEPWMSEAKCRALLAEGRIALPDLAVALEETAVPALDKNLPGFADLSRRAVILAGFERDLAAIGAARCAWLVDEGDALKHFQSSLSPASRQRLLATGSESDVLASLWACCSEMQAPATGDRPNQDASSGLGPVFAEFFDTPAREPEWQRQSGALWQSLIAKVGREWTLSTLLARLTGKNVLETIQPLLIRHLAAHLDQGIAAWPNPARAAGFYAAWRKSAGLDVGWELNELLAAREEIAALPDDPIETIARELMHLGPDETHWGDYLERLALELPGWSGMFLWRDRHAREGCVVPVVMADYLAARLVLERLCCEDLVRQTWGLPLFLSELGDYFLCHPAELWVRHAAFAGLLPELAADAAQRLIDNSGNTDDAVADSAAEQSWEQLASAVLSEVPAGEHRWPLFVLAQHLGLDAAVLRAAGPSGVEQLLQVANELDANHRGHVWLLAYEAHYRQQIFAALSANHGRSDVPARLDAQCVFCMDDREEGTRRHLEEVNPAIETFGAAGFFGVPMYWRGLDDTALTALCPVVVTPGNRVHESVADAHAAKLLHHQQRREVRLGWQQRLHGLPRDGLLTAPLMTVLAAPLALLALSLRTVCPTWLGHLLQRWRRAFDHELPTVVQVTAVSAAESGNAHVKNIEPQEVPREGFTDDEQVSRVAGFLRSIGLTKNFAPLVAIIGHGSASSNNPHLAAYDCGACSGRHGGPNARVFAIMANRPEVRRRLVEQGLLISESTHFVGAEHNTADESVHWYDLSAVPNSHRQALAALQHNFLEATRRHAIERCRRLASAPDRPTAALALKHMAERCFDWSQPRPELGHATIASAFIGRRKMSRSTFFDRRVFLISYDPLADADGKILESTLLAAGPVGAGISLEYYFSTVDNERFGCGSKITHNLAGLFGVMEGTSSDLRTGLPLQMIEIHEPMRLLVVLEQTREIVEAIYARQLPLQELIGNGWIVIAVKEPETGAIYRFLPKVGWQLWSDELGLTAGAAEGAKVASAADSAAWLANHRQPLAPALLEAGR